MLLIPLWPPSLPFLRMRILPTSSEYHQILQWYAPDQFIKLACFPNCLTGIVHIGRRLHQHDLFPFDFAHSVQGFKFELINLHPVFCAMRSIAINPALWRVVSYFGSGFPRPTTRNSGVPVTDGFVLSVFNFSKISYILSIFFTSHLQGRQQGRTTTDLHIDRSLWSACPHFYYSQKS